MSILLKSVLKEAVDALPASLKPNQIVPALKKAGVKNEELELSGVDLLTADSTALDAKGRVAKADLQANVKYGRLDEFSLKEYKGGRGAEFPAKYPGIIPPKAIRPDNQYRERIYKFSHPDQVVNGSTHFDEPNYLMHTRVYDDLIGNQDTRVVAEIQSDLHQNSKADALNLSGTQGAYEARRTLTQSALDLDKEPARLSDSVMNSLSKIDDMPYSDFEYILNDIRRDLEAQGNPRSSAITQRIDFMRRTDSSSAEIIQYFNRDKDKVAEDLFTDTYEALGRVFRSQAAEIPEEVLFEKAGTVTDKLLEATPQLKQIVDDFDLTEALAGPITAENLRKTVASRMPKEITNNIYLVESLDIALRNFANMYNAGLMPKDALKDRMATSLIDGKVDELVSKAAVVPAKTAAWETSWTRKGLENEIMTAIQEGKQQIAIPIKSGVRPFNPDPAQMDELERLSAQMRNDEISLDDAAEIILQRFPELDEDSLINGGMIDYMYDDADRFVQRVRTQRPSESGLSGLHRSSGVQKWYETYVSPLAQKLAKQTNSEFKIENKDGIEYATIKFGPDTKADFKLYSAGGGLAAYMAYQQGYSQEEVTSYMREQGFGEDEIAAANAQQAQIKEAKDAGYSDEEITAFLEQQQPKPVQEADLPVNAKGEPRTESMQLPTPEKQAAEAAIKSGRTLPADELLANLQVISPDMSSVTTRIGAFFGNQEMAKAAQATEEAAINNIKALGKERGLELDWDGEEWTINTEAGPQVVTPGFLREMAAAGGELVGGTAGAIGGAQVGAKVLGGTPLTKAIGVGVGGAIGGIIGAAAGTELDYMYSSMVLQTEMSAEVAAHKALTAAEAAAYGEIVGLGLYKSGGALWRGALRAKNFILDGNSEGARKALRETMFLSEDEIAEVVERFESMVDTTGMSQAQKEITAVATTLPGAEDLVKAAASIDSTASRSVVRGIDNRAKQLQAEIDSAGVDNTARVLREDFTAYTKEVNKFFSDVKMEAASSPRAKYYKFNFEKTAIMPVLESLTDNISNPAVKEKFLLRLNQARKYADGRTFSDLLELRQVVNEFRYNNKIVNAKDFQAIDGVIQSIDARIEAGARFVMPKPQEWLDSFALARSKYSQMKSLEKNGLAKLLKRPGVTPSEVSNALLKSSTSIDGTYESVMAVLPAQMRELAEADMLNTLAKKYTAGEAGGMNAVQFPMFADDLMSRSFVTDHGRQMKEAIIQLGDTFKNDVMLSRHSGMMQVPQFQSYLTADPVVRAKFELASTVFNKVKQNIPGSKSSREIALVRLTAEFLEKPLNAKTVGQLKEAAKDVVSVDEAVLTVQREQAEAIARNMDSSGVKIPVYGTGNILSASGTGQAAMEIPAHRIASPAIVKTIADAEGLTIDSKAALDSALKRYGFKAVQYGSDKVRLLK
jgi:DNA-binding transcriptional MerR regulator